MLILLSIPMLGVYITVGDNHVCYFSYVFLVIVSVIVMIYQLQFQITAL